MFISSYPDPGRSRSAALADAIRLPLGLDALLLQLRERLLEVADRNGDVAVAGAESYVRPSLKVSSSSTS
jgi:hypothetical protein